MNRKIAAMLLTAVLLSGMFLLSACDLDPEDSQQSTPGSSGTQSSSSLDHGNLEPSQSIPSTGEADPQQPSQSAGADNGSQPIPSASASTQSTAASVIQDDRFVPDDCRVLFGTWAAVMDENGNVGRWIFGIDGSFWQIANNYDGTEKIIEGVYYVADGQLYMGPGWDASLSGAEFSVSDNQLHYRGVTFTKESDNAALPA